MNHSEHFKIVSSVGKVLHIEIKGFITDEIVDVIREPILSEFSRAAFAFVGKPWIILVDMSDFRPSSKKGQMLLSSIMKLAQTSGLYHAVEIIPSALTRLSMHSSANYAGHESFRTVVESMEEAHKAVAEKQRDMRNEK